MANTTNASMGEQTMSYGTVQAEKMTTESGYSLGAGNASSFKNRLINGGMTIDQRNAGANVNFTGTAYFLDRWRVAASTPLQNDFSVQQSSAAPSGFTNSMLFTVTTAVSPLSSSDFLINGQFIEGFNTADLSYGTAAAKTTTFSFWVRSSLTGTFGGQYENSATDRSYVFSYTINAANTWEQKSITIPGDVTGTWNTTNGIGLTARFCMGAGSDWLTTPGSWGSTRRFGPTGQVNLMGTLGATWQVTGCQLEVGTVATSWDFRSYGTELQLCQRYYEQDVWSTVGVNTNGSNIGWMMSFKVPKRTTPTFTAFSTVTFQGIVAGVAQSAPGGTVNWITGGANRAGTQADAYYVTTDGGGIGWSASAEL
jgi:hypothetical protein